MSSLILLGACLLLGLLVARIADPPASLAGALGGWPESINAILARIGATMLPPALFAIGMQLRLPVASHQWSAISLGLSWKLLLAPTAVYLIGRTLGMNGMTLEIATLQAAMAPGITATVLVEQYGMDSKLAGTVLGLGIMLSFITVPAINHLLLL